MNEITITGNLVFTPTLRRIGTQAVTKFRIAHNHSYRDSGTGDWIDAGTTFIDVSCWRSLAENVCESIGKGSPVIVTGRLKSKERTQEVDGHEEKRTYYEIEASSVGPDLTRGATRAIDLKREAATRQEDRALHDAMALAEAQPSPDTPWSDPSAA
jgi:single-strand DNA-binding protein